MKKYIISFVFLFVAFTMARAQVIDLTSGGAGTNTGVPQSFNETRGVDVTVLANSIDLTAMTLHRLCTGGVSDSGYASARIYNSATHALLYSHDSVVHPMYDDSVVIPVSYTLNAGQTYRISFSCYGFGNNKSSGSAFLYLPTFSYYDNSNQLQINSAHAGFVDSFPVNQNMGVPFISLKYSTGAPASTDEYQVNTTLSISPNPFNSQTTLYSQILMNNASLRLYNVFGVKVKETNQLCGHTIILQRDHLTAGIYFVQLTQGNEILSSVKMKISD